MLEPPPGCRRVGNHAIQCMLCLWWGEIGCIHGYLQVCKHSGLECDYRSFSLVCTASDTVLSLLVESGIARAK